MMKRRGEEEKKASLIFSTLFPVIIASMQRMISMKRTGRTHSFSIKVPTKTE